MCLSQQFTKKAECISFLQKRREILFGVLCCCCFPSCGGHQHCRQLFLEQTGKRGGGREGGRHTGKAHWQSLGHGPQLLASTQHNRWRLSLKRRCTQTLPVDLARCGFGRRWEETAQRGHNYSAAASTASTSSFCRREFDQTIYSQLCVIMKLTANK